jgi:hypothetical protein
LGAYFFALKKVGCADLKLSNNLIPVAILADRVTFHYCCGYCKPLHSPLAAFDLSGVPVEAVCMKFRFLLWMLGRMMAKASRNNPAFQNQLAGKELTFQLQTFDGTVARHFVVSGQRLISRPGVIAEPAFSISFKDAAFGFATMRAKNKQLAFMQGIQDKDIQITGNPGLVIWFQGLTKFLKPKKKAV